MDSNLRRRLIALNRRFYAQAADRFVDSRRDPWPGWTRVLEVLEDAGLRDGARVLDLGCGHGRFAAFLAERGHRCAYLGVDTSMPLLASGSARVPTGTRLVCADLARALARKPRFDLVVAFGLLHHIPGEQHRRELVERLVELVTPRGHLVLTLWSPDARRRSRARPVEGGEPGDALLPWGEGEAPPERYCHFFSGPEVEALASRLGPKAIRFRADGRGGENHYLIARRSGGR